MPRPDLVERDELESGLTSGFWQRLKTHAEQEWGPAGQTYQAAVRNAISGGVGTEKDAVERLKMIAFAQSAIQQLLKWPEERLQMLQQTQRRADIGASRRGPGL